MFSYKKAKNVLALTAALSVLCSQSVFAATLELDLDWIWKKPSRGRCLPIRV